MLKTSYILYFKEIRFSLEFIHGIEQIKKIRFIYLSTDLNLYFGESQEYKFYQKNISLRLAGFFMILQKII